ncbi:MAG: type VI secretion system ImpA family N-terminal domain-containing protein [Spirochaetaceae bacterium]|jgi:type VI secretion system ImpA family protein|nr:type VI secretion system ImpA family N-terminal domain-containing protein [Spirochaetaceae bacterium]
MIDTKELAKVLAGEKSAGENLEYDQAYLELETLATGAGAAEGEGPDWKRLAKNCASLWEKTRDLRVAVYLTIAETALGGVKELAAGLELINFLIKEMWDTVYPLLDPDDGNDPTERINVFAMLSPEAGAMNDPIMFITRLRGTRLMPPLPYTIRDLLIAQGEIEPLDGQSIDLNLIVGEILGLPLPQVTEQAGYVKSARELIDSICKEANGKMSGGNTLALMTLAKELDKLIKFFNNQLALAGEAKEAADAESPAAPEGEAAAAGPGLRPAAGKDPGGGTVNIANYKPAARTDALLLLKKVIEYYQNTEPNSPIPLLLNRALRMAQMNFLELLENLVPEALPHGRDILGTSGSQPPAGAPPVPAAPAAPAAASAPAASPGIPRIPRVPRVPGSS